MDTEKIRHLIQQFQNRTLPKEDWTHEAHLIVAIWFVKNYTLAEATCYIRAGIIAYNVAVDTPNTSTSGYHETITLFWIRLIEIYIQQHQHLEIEALTDQFLASKYAQKNIFFEYYTKNLLFSTEARGIWHMPDLRPISLL